MGDDRIFFLSENIVSLGNTNDRTGLEAQLADSKPVRDFLDDPRITTLLVALVENGKLSFTCNVGESKFDSNTFDILFVKRSNEPVQPNNIRQIIDVHTLKGTPLANLLSSLKGIWCPALLQNKENSDSLPPRIKQLLSELETTLSSTVITTSTSSRAANSNEILTNILEVHSLQDEINYWCKIKEDRKSQFRNFAKEVDRVYQEIANLQDMSSLAVYQVQDLLDISFDTFHNIWTHESGEGHVYPQSRMVHIFDLIGQTLFQYIQNQLLSLSIWDIKVVLNNYHQLQSKFSQCVSLCQVWIDLPKRLITTYWSATRSNSHPWKGAVYEDSMLSAYMTRLQEILSIITLAHEITQLLSPQELQSMQIEQRIFAPFLNIANPLAYNPYTENIWQQAKKAFEKFLLPIEQTISQKLRQTVFAPYQDHPLLITQELMKFQYLMTRKTILASCVNERENMLTLLKEVLRKYEAMIDNEEVLPPMSTGSTGKKSTKGGAEWYDEQAAHTMMMSGYAGKLTSYSISYIVRLRQLITQVLTIYNSSKTLFHDLENNYTKFINSIEALLAKCKQEENNRYKFWLQETTNRIDDIYGGSSNNMRLTGNLLTWKDGILNVNFHESLVILLRDYRQLDELGFDLPKPSNVSSGAGASSRNRNTRDDSSDKKRTLGDLIVDIEKFYRFGMLLKKIANFYNSISDQIIDIQEQLLLSSLSSFANLVSANSLTSNTRGNQLITWQNNPMECETFIQTLQAAAEKLSSENRSLRKVHEWLITSTIVLMNIDLHKQNELWKSKYRVMKEKLQTIRMKYNEKDCKLWILHWDYQLYKALEISYLFGLEYIYDNISEIKVELVINNKQLELKPSIEQVRQQYYKELKKFMAIPFVFEGFAASVTKGGNTTEAAAAAAAGNNNNSIFKKMCYRNALKLQQIYVRSEELFVSLQQMIGKYDEYMILSSVDMDAYIEQHVTSGEDFVVNFKMIKSKRKDIDKLVDLEKVVNFNCTISLVPFKSYLDDLLLRIHNTLLVQLRRSVMEEFKEIDTFLNQANDKLHSKPRTMEEISAAKQAWNELNTQKPAMIKKMKNVLEKKKLLLQYTPGTGIDIQDILSRMANLEGESGRWEEFEVTLETYHDILEQQKESLKSYLEEEEMSINVELEKFSTKWKQLKPSNTDMKSWDVEKIQATFVTLQDWKNQLDNLEKRVVGHNTNRSIFGMASGKFDSIDTIVNEITNTTKTWDILQSFLTEEAAMAGEEWLSFTNIYALQDFAMKWQEYIKANVPKSSYDSVIEFMIVKIEKMKKAIPALKYCKSDAFKEDHWTELLQGKLLLAKEIRIEKCKVEHFLSRLDILMDPNTLTFVKGLQGRALGEVQIREAMHELRSWELSAELLFLTTEESGRCIPLIKEWKELFLSLGDKQSLLSSLKENVYFKAFADVGLSLEHKMNILDTILHTLNSIQRKWVYLEPIFMRGSLPSEEQRFRRVDENFKEIMNTIVKDPKLFYLADETYFPKLVDNTKYMLDQLERCQKALTEFLEIKRSAMPRFYFIGDDDLLEILGQAKNPQVIQSHLKKLFQGINKVKFDTECKNIIAMISSANEIVDLVTPVVISEKVEDWLEQLAQEMRVTLAALLTQCVQAKKFEWKYPSQILCLSQAITFTQDVERIITENEGDKKAIQQGLHEFKDSLTARLQEYTSHDLSSEPLLQLKMKALVMDLVHNIDVIDQLLHKKISKLIDWIWSKQLRYYYIQKTGRSVVRMHDAEFDYTYEYQGNAPKLVHTPLTDRCYLTLTQGMRMGFGGNPYGPAGTGKTESVKALASCFGRQVLVFNCDEALESASMIRIFIGIVKCGAWGCFDEFNRLKEDQLSAISQQIQIIQDAIKTKSSPITLLGTSINVDFNSGIFVTLNPAGKGYGGRSRLPDNLKALFRPVAMGAPDNELIAEVSLVTEGFTQSKDLASKIVSLFRLSKQLLSLQQHYDWGLRALKAVLNSGGRLIQTYKLQGAKMTAELEYEILIKAIRVNTLSKLTFNDTLKFLALIGDVFPGIKSADMTGGELEEAIKEVMKEKPFFLVEDAGQIKKMLQLKESLDQRMGCVIVGPSGCGKSTLWRVLKAAMIKCGAPVVTYVMNPKSMPRQRLLGFMDMDTREWADGVLTDAARKVVKESSDVHCWIICDGDVDPEWIESLNSVLDDNHLLTLPNGERISFGSNVNFLFETHDLKFASPATVSRMGMIFLSDEDLDVSRLIQRWLSSFPQDKRMSVSQWMDELFYKALDFVLKYEMIVETTLVGIVMNGLSQLKEVNTRNEFVCAVIRGLGGNLSVTNRIALAKEVFQWSGERPPDLNLPLDCYADGTGFKSLISSSLSNAVIHSNNPVLNELGQDIDRIKTKDIGTAACVIPTITLQRNLLLLDSWINSMEPFILVGPEGCGKNLLIHYAFSRKKNISITTLHCNAQTTSDDIINKIAQTCSLYSSSEGRIYRPRDCERLVLYLKDINLPRPDQYDTCQLIAFLQQIITFGGFYNEELEFLKLEKIQIVASMNAATTVGRHPLSTRFTAVVRVGVIDYPETSELITIFDSFLLSILKSMKVSDNRWLSSPMDREKLTNTIVDVYGKIREKFTVDDRRHYLFTLRDITLWVKNISRYDLGLDNLLDVIVYEANRIFRDRLVDIDAMNKFDQILSSAMRQTFRHGLSSTNVFYTSLSISTPTVTLASTNKKGESKGSGGNHDNGGEDAHASATATGGKLTKMNEDEFKKLIQQGILYYEREERDLNMLLFPEVLEQISHVDRVLSNFSNGHLLLIGKSGVGRRNAVTIASYMLRYHFITPAITRDYNAPHSKSFANEIKNVLEITGVKGEHVVFFVEDFQITKESILETINSLISSGEVPGLYTHEELEPLMSSIRKIMQEDENDDFGNNSTPKTPYEFFIARIKKYLHIVLCMDPHHPSFLYRCESNPALYSTCSVLWIGEWKSASLKEIPILMDGIKEILTVSEGGNGGASHARNEGKSEGKHGEAKRNNNESKFHDFEHDGGEGDGHQQVNEQLLEMIINIHNSCCHVPCHATPKDYITFLKTWHSLFGMKKRELLIELGHLEAGLNKLDSAAEIVHDLRTNAKQQEKDLKIAQAAADKAMEEISKAISASTDRRNEVGEVKRAVADNEAKTQARKEAIENELSEIQPILESAKTAVNSIRPEHLTEIRSLTAPPEAIADVLAAVLMMLGVQDLSWLSMKKFLSNRGVKDDILNFDAKRISPELRKNVAKLLKKKPASFDDANIQRVSAAAAPMAAWVKANIRYSLVIEKIEPLQVELEEEISKLEQSQKRLKKCEEELKEIDDRIALMKKEFGARTAEAERLKANLSIAGETLDKAENLIGQLSGEQKRWKTQAAQLKGDLSKLPMKMLLAAGFATYLAKTSEDIRASMLTKWQDITNVSQFVFKRVMSTESELLQWKGLSLPADDLSQENGLVICHSIDRIPFIIDPASAAINWLRATLAQDKNRPLEVVTQFDTRFMNQVELAVRFGKTLLIVEADGLEPALFPLCRKDLCHQGPRYVVKVGDKVIDYNEGFRMFLVTRNPTPDIAPDASALLTIVNFTVTRSGLEGQLLGLAIQHEQPELERAKGEMLKKEEDFKVQLAKLEKELLEALATAEGNLLENTSLIESLTRTKEKSAEIEEALVKSAEASVKLDQQREVYRPFALSGAKLYFLVKNLQNICHMYQFSLASFLTLFKQALSAESKTKNTEERLNVLVADMEVRVLYFVGRALFKADRPMFALHIVKGMHADHFQPKEWEIFTGTLVASVSEAIPKGYPNWAPSERKDAFRVLQEQLPHLISSLELENVSKWQRFSTSLEAERDLPSLRGISPFQKVLIIQAFRPDRLQSAILSFCMDMLRIDSISPPPISLPQLFEEVNPLIPLLIISSPGADASKELQEYAGKTIGAGNYEELAMGGGQQDTAVHLLRNAATNGSWLCLKNLHLVISWLPTLEKELASLHSPHADFRLILTSEQHHHFTTILLQTSLKCTFESPPGIKKNLLRTFETWDQSDLFDNQNPLRSRLLFLLATFHSIVQERRTYIPQGWTKFYEFSYGDLKAGTYVVEAVTEGKSKNTALDWEIIHGLMEDAIYGGRIDNAFDVRVLRAYLGVFFSDRLVSENSTGVEVIAGTPLRMPSTPDVKGFNKIISQLPDVDAPYVFSLPDNIERSLQRTNSTNLIRQLRILSSSDAEASKYDREKWRAQLTPIMDLWTQMLTGNPGIVSRKVGREVQQGGGSGTAAAHAANTAANTAASGTTGAGGVAGKQKVIDPVDDFVMMEYDLAGEICGVVDASLSALKKVLFGSGLLTPAIQIAATALLAGTVPNDWKKHWEASPEKPQSWLRELVRKRLSLAKWKQSLSKGGSTGLLSTSLSLSDLFNPGTFINALRQQTARHLNTAIDLVKMICSWEKNAIQRVKQDCPLPCMLSNFLLQGAIFQNGTLVESAPEGSELTPISDVCIGFVVKTARDMYDTDEAVAIPIYLTPSREDFLTELQMPMNNRGDHDRWILAGAALFLTEDD